MKNLFFIFCAALLFLSFTSCQKNKSPAIPQQTEKQTRGSTLSISTQGLDITGEFSLIRSEEGNWYAIDENGNYYKKKPTQPWKFVPTLTNIEDEVENAMITYSQLHPDNLLLPFPPQSCIYKWKLNANGCPLPQYLVKTGVNWNVQTGQFCPRWCD